ncbi:MAG: hypothetical protein IT378_07055 [Sandaracinaceae bacterium]|nr:hypothetical protein [Sandaracinaceae bacterium]
MGAVRRLFGGLPGARAAAGLKRAASEREDALRWLRQRLRDGEPVRPSELPPALRRAIGACFASYDEAMEAAAGGERFRTSADTVAELQRVHATGLAIAAPELTAAGHHDLVRAIGRFFGDLATAREAAGVASPEPPPLLPVQVALEALRQRARELGRAPRAGELQPTVRARLLERFGSYESAIRAAGLDTLALAARGGHARTSKVARDTATSALRTRRGNRLPADGAPEAPRGSTAGGIEET